jgi:hypothetical protein
MGGHVIFRSGAPISWSAHREARTSRSSCEAEILATDAATKAVQYLRHVMTDLGLPDRLHPTPLYNDNQGCIDWAHTMSTKRLRHFNIRENAVRDAILLLDIVLSHIAGVRNPSDLFTKEHRDFAHFLSLVSCFLSLRDLPASMGGVELLGDIPPRGYGHPVEPQLCGSPVPTVPDDVDAATSSGTGTGS